MQKVFALLILLAATSCGKFELSPYSVEVPGHMHDLNQKNIDQLMAGAETADDTVTILFTGDSQRFYDELELLVAKTNTLHNVDFFVLSGDISDFGLVREFEWIYEKIEQLNMPYLCAIGNHDLTARGGEIYRQVYGPENFSFVYKGYEFLFHNTNGREYGFNGKVPDLSWLASAINDGSAQWHVAVSHVPPFNNDFDPALQAPYKDLFGASDNFILSLHGHNHITCDGFYNDDHVRYIVSNSVHEREALLLKLYRGVIFKQFIPY